jgi:hypothetical protein
VADAGAQTDWREEYRQLRKQGVPKEQALAQMRRGADPPANAPDSAGAQTGAARATQAAAPRDVSIGETAALGLASGATADFDDEIAGAYAAYPARDPMDRVLPRGATPPRLTQEETLAAYRAARDDRREAKKAAQEARPGLYLATQIGGGIATAPFLPGGAVASASKAAVAGAGYGMLAGAGASEADLTRGEAGQFAADIAKGGTIGGIAGPVASLVGKGVGALVSKVRGTRGAEKVAAQTAERIGGAKGPLAGETLSRMERASQLEEKWGGLLGEKKQFFSAAEASGDPALALTEMKSRQLGGAVGSAAQAERKSRLQNTAKVFDLYANEIAGNPGRLGKAEIGEQFGNVVKRHLDELRELRSGVAAQMLDEVDRIAGNQKIVPMKETASSINQLIEELRTPLATSPDKALIAELESLGQKMIAAADGGAPIDARFTMKEMQNALSGWGKKSASGEGVVSGERQSWVASRIFGALQRDLDNAASEVASGQLGAAGQALVRARDAYREMSEEIAAVSTEAIEKITKKAGTDAADTMTDRVLGMSPQQIGGVFRVAEKADPALANQMRAEMFQTLLERAGKPRQSAQELADLGITKLQPGKALGLLDRHWEKMQAAYAGNPKARLALTEIAEGLRNLATGPGLEGSQTAPLVAESLRDLAGSTAARAVDALTPGGGTAVQALGKAVIKITRSEQAAMKAVSTPEGIQAYRDALRLQLAAQKGKKPSEQVAAALLVTFKRLGFLAEEEITDPKPAAVRRGSL